MILKSKKQRKVVGIISVAVIAIVLLGSGYVTKGISNKLGKDIVLSSEKENIIDNSITEENVESALEEKLEEEKLEAEEVANNIEIKKEEIVKEPVEDKKSEPKQEQQVQKPQQTTENPIKCINEKLGIELTIPSYWRDKFIINNTNAGISIDYIFQYDSYVDPEGEIWYRGEYKTRAFVWIEDMSRLEEEDLWMMSTIYGAPKYIDIHGKKYVIGGPTDYLGLNDPDEPTFAKFRKDIPSIINSIKEI